MPLDEALQVMSRYLARRDVAELAGPADLLVLMGSAVVESVEVVAQAYHRGAAARILVSGGLGHSTHHLVHAVERRGLPIPAGHRPESHIFRDLLHRYGVDPAAVTVEDDSTNCGENAAFTRRLLDHDSTAYRLVLVQDPTMQRRTHAAFERSFRDRPGTALTSFAPLIPWIGDDAVGAGPGGPPIWARERFVSLLLGEIRRLRDDIDGYGPRGRNFIDHVEVPPEVLAAFDEAAAAHPTLVRPSGG
ncbi:protein of unknown function DUF218 [Kribbella flavida DSM 17836]|uniref:DUF218 domain-containing protein n=1 Tax=Kribbella flavida (strain DSM 17836 / JCM 10339 / NBRC 14399) TaxID=479435 RepID=D2PSA9_KRIFD|nr:YdcF family protein [Kribbella flavida]ADB31233.1 protein of unknown function DUF218 [Kribbella flavida DSM 17836]